MAISRQKKEEIAEKLSSIVRDSESVAFVRFHKLPVDKTTELRKSFREQELGYYVAKKTLIRRAFEDSSVTGEMPELEGEIAVVYGTDALAPARESYAFQKKFKKKFFLVGGVFEGAYKNEEEITEIATIPPLEVLRGMFVNVINSPIQSFVIALGQIAEKKEG